MTVTPARAGAIRRTGLGIAALIALGLAILQLPATATGTAIPAASAPAVAPDSLVAPAQSTLDQVLGTGHSLVTASATYGTGSHRVSVQYGTKAAVLAQSTGSGPGYQGSTTNNGVSGTVTDATVPSGRIQRLTVAVVVDSALRPAPALTTIQKIVSASLGLQTRRGDRITIARLPMAGTGAVTAAATTTTPTVIPARFAPYVQSALFAGLAVVLLLFLAVELVRRRS
jgi:flagellar biosynthesis/type III secretory pathway M-ring protein FliF/YscJ